LVAEGQEPLYVRAGQHVAAGGGKGVESGSGG
jgi:hypothetical protein